MTTLTQDNTTNQSMTKDSILKRMQGLGRDFGKGMNSRPAMAALAVEAGNRGFAGPKDADEYYGSFAKGIAAEKGIEWKATASHEVQVSKTRQFIKLGALKDVDGVKIFNRASDVITRLGNNPENPMKLSAYDAMVKVAREQVARPDQEYSSDEIETMLSKQPEEKDEIEKVIDLYKRMSSLSDKLHKDNSKLDLTNLQDAILSVAEQIRTMDGKVPAITKDDKALAAAEEVLARRAKAAADAAAEKALADACAASKAEEEAELLSDAAE